MIVTNRCTGPCAAQFKGREHGGRLPIRPLEGHGFGG